MDLSLLCARRATQEFVTADKNIKPVTRRHTPPKSHCVARGPLKQPPELVMVILVK